MEEYMRNMKSLRSQMNDFEEEAATISVEEQKQGTAIQTVENDLRSVISETERLREEKDEMVKAKGELCCHILEKQKKASSLEIESATLSQTLELLQQERASLSEKLIEKRTYFSKVQEDLSAKLLEQQEWLSTRKLLLTINKKVEEYPDQQKDFIEGNVGGMAQHSSSSDAEDSESSLMVQLKSLTAKLPEVTARKSEVVVKNSKSNQLIEQLKHKTEGFPAELNGMDVKSLEEEHKALLADKAGELEYLQSLQDRVKQLQGISEEVKCQCGKEYKVELRGNDFCGLSGTGSEMK